MTAETINQRKLRQALVDAFNEAELRGLCFDLDIDYEELAPGSKLIKVPELIARCVREQRVDALISLCESARPKVNWRGMMATAVSDESAPFMGLKYYDAAHADLFFGRETLTADLAEHLRNNHFLAVVGASGSGKSSLVRAGLVPAMQAAQPNLKTHTFTPTDQPLEALATTLTRHTDSVGVTAKFIDAMASDPRSLHLAARRLVQDDDQLLLVIDQFEELFTLCRSEEKRQAFIDNLGTAVSPENNQSSHHPTRAVIALRADFYHHCAQYDALRHLLETQQRYIGAMSPTELRRAIEMPAQQNNLTFEDGLVDLLLRDVGASGEQRPEPGALPLLSHALLETWRRREGNKLTFGGYTDAGGVQGAIAKTAESVFSQKLTPAQQTIARSIFLRLTELGEGTQDTRRRALISELLPASDAADETQTVLNLLSAARLVTTDEATAEVTHEALIREWPTLRRWLDENRDGLRLHRHLTESAQEWQQLSRDSGELYRGARLEQAQEWATQHEDELNDLEREFLAVSVQTVKHRERSERLIQILGIGALLIILVGTIVASLVFSRQAADNRALAETAVAGQETAVSAGELAVVSTTDAAANAATATALVLNQDIDADGLTLIQELNFGTDPYLADSDEDGLLDGVEFSLGTNLKAIDTDLDDLLDGNDNEPLRPIISTKSVPLKLERVFIFDTDNNRKPIFNLSISHDNVNIAATSPLDQSRSMVYFWNFDGSMQTRALRIPYETGSETTIKATALSGNRLYAIVDSEISYLDLTLFNDQNFEWQRLRGNWFSSTIYSAAISGDGTFILFGGQAVWELGQIIGDEARQIVRDSQNDDTNVQNFVSYFSYDGRYFGRIRDDGSVFIGETFERSFGRPFNKSAEGAYDVGVTSDGNILLVGYKNGRVELYDYSERSGGPPLIYGLDAHPSNAHAVFSPDDTIIATSSPDDGTVKLWRVADGELLLELDAEADGVTSLIFSQDGHLLLFGTTAGEIHVYGMPEVQR